MVSLRTLSNDGNETWKRRRTSFNLFKIKRMEKKFFSRRVGKEVLVAVEEMRGTLVSYGDHLLQNLSSKSRASRDVWLFSHFFLEIKRIGEDSELKAKV